jgi:hypothetical protein
MRLTPGEDKLQFLVARHPDESTIASLRVVRGLRGGLVERKRHGEGLRREMGRRFVGREGSRQEFT